MVNTGVGVKADLRRASHCLEKNDLQGAAGICAKVITKAPRNARAHYLLGAIAQREGRGKDAADHACTAARLRPDLASLQFTAGSLLYREKSFAASIGLYEAAVERDPENADYHLGAASALRKLGRNDEASAAISRADAASPRDARVQYKLGQHLRSTGDIEAAAKAYARALELESSHALAAFWLAATRKLISQEASRGFVAKINRGCIFGASTANIDDVAQGPPAAPREYVVGLYNSYAETFDSHLQGSLSYKTPTIVVETLSDLFPGRRWRRCLDLGCGTGLSGQAASAVCDRLVGIDLSPAMVRHAKEKRVYCRLLVGDVTDTVRRLCADDSRPHPWDVPLESDEEGGAGGYKPRTQDDPGSLEERGTDYRLSESKMATGAESEARGGGGGGDGDEGGGVVVGGAQDLVLSCDVFVYIGDLRKCFSAVHDLVGGLGGKKGGAVFAFSAEANSRSSGSEGGDTLGYELQGTGRFTHSRAYLERTCREAGFRVLEVKNVVLRENAGSPVKGFVFITEAIA